MATQRKFTKRTRKKAAAMPFTQKLVLNQWLLSLFETTSFDTLADPLKTLELEGLDENGVHKFHASDASALGAAGNCRTMSCSAMTRTSSATPSH